MSSAASAAPRRRSLRWLPPTETLDLGGGLSLSPRLRLLLTFFRADLSVAPLDEWKLKLALLRSPSLPTLSDDDLLLRRAPDPHKLRRGDPVAFGTLYVRDLAFLRRSSDVDGDEEDEEAIRKRFLEWRSSVVERLGGIELNLEGLRFRMEVEIPPSDDFERMKRSWEDCYASQLLDGRSSVRRVPRRPDTIIVQGVPSRWFAEPRVSSKASMLVTHTIFSVLGKIRNLNVAGEDDLGKNQDETTGEMLSGLNCKVWVQFENYDEFYNAMKVLCGRSLQKQGSRLKVDYEVTWDRDDFFRTVPQKPTINHGQERGGSVQLVRGRIRDEAIEHRSQLTHFDSDGSRRKRFRLVVCEHKIWLFC
ncbi:uncharacterized protein LOC109721762 isoform X1 [Ananas comosus]|uniref:Uncharacterized protein LOC109721762 isoform X1 n=1 Tax=Ananas comosus TaxID=4615 RepID=A0A6P5GA86_ANACO|nr:uncharacterized protein LOC109721762 isoform X1 [Ananas comosus]